MDNENMKYCWCSPYQKKSQSNWVIACWPICHKIKGIDKWVVCIPICQFPTVSQALNFFSPIRSLDCKSLPYDKVNSNIIGVNCLKYAIKSFSFQSIWEDIDYLKKICINDKNKYLFSENQYLFILKCCLHRSKGLNALLPFYLSSAS
jgi:hypothetical protein